MAAQKILKKAKRIYVRTALFDFIFSSDGKNRHYR